MPRGRPGKSEPVDTEKFYKTLGVEKTADTRSIKKAYLKLARIHHPDKKTGNEEKFKEIQTAYDVLSDESKREIYDKYGEKGLESGGSPAPSSVFDLFGGGGRRRKRGPEKPQEIVQTIDLTLADVWYGPAKQIHYKYLSATKKVVCEKCDGQGAVMAQVRAGPGMIMQTQRTCPACEGKGVSWEGEKQVKCNKKLNIPKGVKNGNKIKLAGEGHNLPGMERGDVTFLCRVAKHRNFVRQGADLAMKKQLTLKEALCGFSFKITHPSGTVLNVKSGENEIVSPGQLKRIDQWGLPQKGSYDTLGNLYIKFEVLFPVTGSVTSDDIKGLKPKLEKLQYPAEKAVKVTLGMGVRVKLVNLNSKQFIGKLGTVIAESAQRGRWPIELDAGKKVAVPENCLEIVETTETKSKPKANGMDVEDDDEYPEEEDVVLTAVKGNPKRTPAAAAGRGEYDEDEEEEGQGGMECQHM